MARRKSAVSKQAALAYAAEGWPVLACYTNTPEGCSCGDSRCISPGKHPMPKYSPHGVQSATTDLDEIASWKGEFNIGIALGHKDLMALDVDDAEIAAALLSPDFALQEETGAVRTGRGVHVYFLCSGEKKTMHLRDKVTGNKIGHIAGLGAYTIAPPSAAVAGKFYKWLHRRQGQENGWIPKLAKASDAYAYVKRLLAPLKVDAVGTKAIDIENLPDVEIEEHDLEDISPRLKTSQPLLGIRQRLRGQRPDGARDAEQDISGWEHFVACEIVRVARETYRVKHIDPLVLAGIIKKLDRVYYGKFESDVEAGRRSRAGADRRYHVSAIHALDAVKNATQTRSDGQEKPKRKKTVSDTDLDDFDDTAPEITGLTSEPSYIWDEDAKKLFHVTYHKKGQTATRVANFNVRLLSEIMVDKGDTTPDRAWRVRCESPFGLVKEVSLRAEEFDSTRSIEQALTRKLSHEFIVSHNGHGHLKPAILELTDPNEVQRYAIRAVPGWWTITNEEGDEERVYLLPSALGAISRHGMIPSLRMKIEELAELDDDIARKEFEAYGKNVRPPTTKEERVASWRAFKSLVEVGPVEKTMPIILQILMGPLWSAGADEVPSLLHITGRTGVLKTSFCLAAMSMFGTFRQTTPPTASWPSVSPSALRSLLSAAKDLTVLVDDYKEGAVYDKRGMRELVQAYADKSFRQRLKSSGERRKSLELQAVILSNGEDRWEREASMVARTIFININNNDFSNSRLRAAQKAVLGGEMQLFGGRYLTWLAAQDELFEQREIEDIRQRWHQKLLRDENTHRRVLGTVSTVAATGDIFLRFIKDCYPKHYSEARQWVRTAVTSLAKGTKERGKEVQQLAPLRQLLDYIADEASARRATLLPITGIGSGPKLPDAPNAEIVGYYSRSEEEKYGKKIRMLHLNENVTFGWYHREMKRQGKDVIFSWNAVVQEARNGYKGFEHRHRVGKERRQIRLLSLPLKYLDIGEVH